LITTRRIQSGEAELFKKLRLLSLQDAPYAFSSSYESALRRTDVSWREQAERTAQGMDRATFISFSDEEPVGMAALYRLENQADVGELLQVWVAPEYRRKKVAKNLMDAVFTWAGENNFRKIIASVRWENARAIQFYLKYGFLLQDTDASEVVLAKAIEHSNLD
jgi:RimJ/RimL family protein N-acetyltransferase